MSQAIFTRLKDGSWGVRVNTEVRPDVGDRILISKRDGSVVNAIIAEVQWFGTARDGRLAALVTIEKTPRRAQRKAFDEFDREYDDENRREYEHEND